MNNNLAVFTDPFIKYLSVGSVLQNLLFYGFILLLLSINIVLVKRKRGIGNNEILNSDNVEGNEFITPITQSGNENQDQRIIELQTENDILKAELLALGEELELSYSKSDRLNNQLTDILGCLDSTVFSDEYIWNWSIVFDSDELILSQYGLQVCGYPSDAKLTWMEALDIISDEYKKQVETALIISLKTGADFSMVYKIKATNQSPEKWIRSFGKVVYNINGTPVKLEGKFTFTTSNQLAT